MARELITRDVSPGAWSQDRHGFWAFWPCWQAVIAADAGWGIEGPEFKSRQSDRQRFRL